jgi:DNA-binding HxlR family transcriptional regulator
LLLHGGLPAGSTRYLFEPVVLGTKLGLKDLEADGLVERHVHAGPPVRVEYRLTEKGAALSTILPDLNRWALKWIDLPADH